MTAIKIYFFISFSASVYFTVFLLILGHSGGGSQWAFSTYGLQVLTPDNLRTVFSIEAHYEKTKEGIIFQPLSVLNNSNKNSAQGDTLK